MTKTSEILEQAAILIDDARLNELLEISPALYYRRMSGYIPQAVALLNSPPELYHYISGSYVAVGFTDCLWASTADSLTQETVIEGYTGYDLCSVTIRSSDGAYVLPYSEAVYDAEAGTVTFPIQTQENIIYDIDFYKDGEVNDLSLAKMRLFALAISVIWYERFNNNWLNMQPKVKDSSFDTVNESNYIEKMTIRNEEIHQQFNDEMKKYEQNCAYNKVVGIGKFYKTTKLI